MTNTDAGRAWTPRRALVVGSAVAAGLAAAFLAMTVGGLDLWFVGESAIAGALVGNLAWLGAAPRSRVTRLAGALLTVSAATWIGFLAFGEPHVADDRPSSDVVLIHDAPIMVAGRSVGPFGSVNAADRALNVMAGPAVFYASAAIMAASGQPDESVGRSYVMAGLAAILSSAFWLAVGNTLAARLARRARVRAAPRTPD